MPPDPDPDPQDPAEPEPAPGADPADPADPAEPASYGIAHGLGSTGLVAGEEAILPILLQAPGSAGGGYAPVFEGEAESVAALGNEDADGPVGREAEAPGGAGYAPVVERDAESVAALGKLDALEREAEAPGDYAPATERLAESTTEPTAAERRGRGQGASERVTLDITMPSGITLASETADPGWACTETEAVVHCTIAAMPDPAEANVRIRIGEEVSGYQTFEVAVEGPGISGTTALQVPIAPAGSEVGYASVAATGIAAAGNTWLTCAVPGCHEVSLIGGGDRWPMRAYKPDTAPAGREDDAVSGAVLEIPGGAEIEWAGLYWAGAHEDLPSEVSLAGPGGSWTGLSAASMRDTHPGEQAFVEVTGLVSSGGAYWVATDNHQLPTSVCPHGPIDAVAHCIEPHWAGWSLTVVYAEPGAEAREVAVYDGAPAADTEIEVEDGGEVDIAATLWGGSGHQHGDSLTAGGQGLGEPASCRARGALENPHWYTFGVDVNAYRAQTGENAVVRFERGDDPFIVGVVAIASPLGDETAE